MNPTPIKVAIVTVSDSVASGTREDGSGARLRERAEALGWRVIAQEVAPDEMDRIAEVLTRLADSGEVSRGPDNRGNGHGCARCHARGCANCDPT
jgi:molybdopterin biosynthesis enzyme MoaB